VPGKGRRGEGKWNLGDRKSLRGEWGGMNGIARCGNGIKGRGGKERKESGIKFRGSLHHCLYMWDRPRPVLLIVNTGRATN